MCRILYFSGNTSNLKLANNFIDSLVEASKHDVLAPNGPTQHKDGFGYVVFGEVKGQKEEISFKSVKPIFESENDIINLKQLLKAFDRFALGIHSRKVSVGNVNMFNAHPFYFSTQSGISLFLMHNGTLFKDKLQEALNIKGENGLTDSYLLGLMLERRIVKLDMPSFVDFFKNSLPFVSSTLNTITLFSSVDNKFGAFLTTYYRNNQDYMQIFTYEKNGAFAFASSTVYYYAKGKGILMSSLENGKTLFIEDVFADNFILSSILDR